MKSIIPILALGIVFATSGAMAKSMGHGSSMALSPPTIASTPSIAPIPSPTLNPGAIGVPGTFGNPGLIGPASSSQIDTPDLSGALPGEPGSPSYDPNAALPSLGNAGSALAPNPGTSGAGFNTPSVSSGTSQFSGTGG